MAKEKTRKYYYREMIVFLIPMDDDLEVCGASKKSIDAFKEMISILQEDCKPQYGEYAW